MIASLQKTSDQLQWDALLNGNRDALANIYNEYFDLLYEYGMRLYHDPELVKDCIQDLFIKLWVNRSNLNSTDAVKPYLFAALRSTILNKIEQIHRMKMRDSLAVGIHAFDLNYATIEDTLISNDEEAIRKNQVKAALNNLTSRQKESIYLRFYLGLEYAEIAEIMQVSVKASYKIIGRAIMMMRKFFRETAYYGFILFFLMWIICDI